MNGSFQRCIGDICGWELASTAQGKYAVFDDSVAVVEGHGGITEYCADKVRFAYGKRQLEICGKCLKIKCLERHFAVIVGKICCVAVKDV